MVEKAATVPKLPTGAPSIRAPCACAQSSINGTPWLLASRAMSAVRAGSPAMWATTMALVRGPNTASISSGPQLKEPGSVSVTTGMQPSNGTGMIPPGSVIAGTTTSVNGSTPSARNATYRAAVPELTASAYPPPRVAANSAQYASSSGPPYSIAPPAAIARSTTPSTAARSSAPIRPRSGRSVTSGVPPSIASRSFSVASMLTAEAYRVARRRPMTIRQRPPR